MISIRSLVGHLFLTIAATSWELVHHDAKIGFGSFFVEAWTPNSQPFTTKSNRLINLLLSASVSKEPSVGVDTESNALSPTAGSVVTVKCRLVPEGDFVPEPLIDGVFLEHPDNANEMATLSFVLHEGNYLPGLHDLIASMSVGDKVSDVSLDAGWGAHNPELVVTIAFEACGLSPDQVKPGMQLYLSNGAKCTVTAVSDKGLTIDANSPLAGASYLASVELVSVEPGPVVAAYTDDEETLAKHAATSRYQAATFALGCFWGGELAYMREKGVVGTQVGYSQGQVESPTYEQVCSGTTGHTEAILVKYDPTVVSYERLCQLAMDRLGENKYLLNQVGNDRGTQYRHGIYYHTPEQKDVAERIVGHYGEDCVTECKPATKWWKEQADYHQQYLLKGGQSARKGDDAVIRCYG